jgi:hypothetical protein
VSTSYGLACPEHDQECGRYVGRQNVGRQSLAAIWAIREHLAAVRESPAWAQLIKGHTWLGIDDTEAVEEFVVAHRRCPVELVSEYGDRELPDDVARGLAEPDADEIVRVVLTRLQFPDDAIDRTVPAIVDALDATRVLSYNRRPARLRGGV